MCDVASSLPIQPSLAHSSWATTMRPVSPPAGEEGPTSVSLLPDSLERRLFAVCAGKARAGWGRTALDQCPAAGHAGGELGGPRLGLQLILPAMATGSGRQPCSTDSVSPWWAACITAGSAGATRAGRGPAVGLPGVTLGPRLHSDIGVCGGSLASASLRNVAWGSHPTRTGEA